MNFIREYESANETSKFGFGSSTVASACNGHYDTYKGYIWLWKNSPEIYYQNKQKRKDKVLKDKKAKERIILQYSKQLDFLREWTYDEILEHNLNLCAIQNNCCGQTKSSQGYIWKYKEKVA